MKIVDNLYKNSDLIPKSKFWSVRTVKRNHDCSSVEIVMKVIQRHCDAVGPQYTPLTQTRKLSIPITKSRVGDGKIKLTSPYEFFALNADLQAKGSRYLKNELSRKTDSVKQSIKFMITSGDICKQSLTHLCCGAKHNIIIE